MTNASTMSGASRVWDDARLKTFRDNVLNRPLESINTGWEDTLIPLGLLRAGSQFHDSDMLDWAQRWTDYHLDVPVVSPDLTSFRVQSSGAPHRGIYLTPYCGEWGVATVIALAHELRPSEARLAMVRRIADHICDGSIRVGDGVIAHGHWSRIPWVDTLYYSSSPLAHAYRLTGEPRYAAEAINQCLLHAQYLRDEMTGCFFHEADPVSGQRTSWFWSRGNGWIVMALADTLLYCPADTPGWRDVLDIFRSQITGLLRYMHPSGLWRIVPEVEESHLETSGSIMISTGLAVGVKAGWLDKSVGAYARRTWNEVLTWIDRNGHLMGCQSPAGMGGWETHKLSLMGERTYGTGSLLRFAADMALADLI